MMPDKRLREVVKALRLAAGLALLVSLVSCAGREAESGVSVAPRG